LLYNIDNFVIRKRKLYPVNSNENMKKFLLLTAIFILLSSSLFGGDKSWFKSFRGTVGSASVTMNILMYQNEIKGYYYYDKYSVPMNVLGSLKGDSLSLIAYLNSYETESFKGVFKGGNYSGEWSLDTSKKTDFLLKENNTISRRFEYVYVYGKEELFKNMEYPPSATYTEGSIWPSEDFEHSDFIRKQILKEKNYPLSLGAIGSRMLESKKKYMADFFEMNKGVKEEEAKDMGWSYTMEDQDILTFAYMNENIGVLSRFYYAYTGGAHGNYGTGFTCLDLKDESVIKLADILNSPGIKKLPELLEKNYRKQNEIDPKQTLSEAGLFEDSIKANDNFIITPGALVFCYSPYEIAPYAAGEVMIYIPIEEIEEFIKPEFKKLLQ
jgi:hypothetical protein